MAYSTKDLLDNEGKLLQAITTAGESLTAVSAAIKKWKKTANDRLTGTAAGDFKEATNLVTSL